MVRTSPRELDQLAKRLSDASGYHFYVAYAYGAPQLEAYLEGSSGTDTISPRMAHAQLADYMRAMLLGMSIGTGKKSGPTASTRWKRSANFRRGGRKSRPSRRSR